MAERKDEEFGISAVALESLERNFVEVMKELSAEDNLERFKLEYEKLHRALKKSHESEKRLIKKCQELNQEIVSNAAKIQSALQLSQEDEASIVSLRKEIEKAWKMVDGANEKEAKAKDTILALSNEVKRLNTLVEQGAGLTLGHKANLQDLIEGKKEDTKARDATRSNVQQLTHDAKEWADRIRKQTGEMELAEIDLVARNTLYQQLFREYGTEQQQREMAEKVAHQRHNDIDRITSESEEAKRLLDSAVVKHDVLDRKCKEQKESLRVASKKLTETQHQLSMEVATSTQLDQQNMLLKDEIPKREVDLTRREQELAAILVKVKQLDKVVQGQDSDIELLKKEKDEVSRRNAEHQENVNLLLAEIEKHRRILDERERMTKEKSRAKNLAIAQGAKEETERVKLEGQRVIEQGKNRSLAQELESYLRSNERMREEINMLEKQQQKCSTEAQEISLKHAGTLDQVKSGVERASQLQVELEDAEKKLKNQQSMYEQVRSDRALYKKNLNEAQAEIDDMQRRFKLMDHHIDQLKDELSCKERLLCEAHKIHAELGKAIANADQRVSHLREDHIHAKGRGDALADEIKQLSQIISDCDAEKAKQQMKFNSVTNERNILATQLIRRNDELALLYEKIRIQQSTLAKGENQYRERLVDIRMRRDKVQELRLSLRIALVRIRNVEEFKRQVTTLQRQLMQERTKVKALYEELQNPMNVHPWRRIEGSDPEKLESILKIHTLQKRLVDKTEECTAKEQVIKLRDAEYNQLKNILSRQPGPEIAEQLNVYHENILKRAGQLHTMEQELKSSQSQIGEYQSDVQRLTSELAELKKRFFAVKSKNTILKRVRSLASMQNKAFTEYGQNFVIHHPSQQPRFAGGGFSLSQ